MSATVIRVSAPTAKVRSQPVNRVRVSPADGARVVVVAIPQPGPQGPAGAPGDGARVVGETPTGARDGFNTVFTTASAYRAGTTAVYLNGLREIHCAETAPTAVTFSDPPLSTDVVTIDYVIDE